MKYLRILAHCLRYGLWLVGQIIKESTVMAIDTLGTGRNIAPVVIYYPLRITKERDIAAFTASITMTPGTLALGITGPKEVDYDAEAGNRSRHDASAVGESEFGTHGLETVQRFLAVHAMYGSHPQELLDSLAEMEERLVPSIKDKKNHFDVQTLVERGRPGPRGFRGSHGGRVSDETVFDVEKVDSTPHAAAFVAAILEQDEEESNPEDVKNMNREERYAVAQRNVERARSRRTQSPKRGPMTDIDTFRGDKLGSSRPDREGRTKPGETLYDPLYPKNNPKDGDVDGSQLKAPLPKAYRLESEKDNGKDKDNSKGTDTHKHRKEE
ncbi:Na+/H+ antiporter subunit E [Corynebacterium anserum]|uniref:MnhE protein n=1 Tax=Corynebacterium anserum TaxID=2684406 RepID=A0A7G7YQF2_9CORY|nr:Na+/H+ antiporter subunit E [Corynebacterium anserum]MBC2682408.1 MnhE protein [Corynebacterium anserum]QNH96722.1 MnhE protein [Corynebacterium anserum]